MKINADLERRALVFSEEIPWVDSPLKGVQRRMLERDGEEVARATSIVRYAPNSHFSSHTHGGGEEFLVLDGVFSDERGNYGAGSYVRNPAGSRHTPYSKNGCTIFVKLRQMKPEDQRYVSIDTKKVVWQSGVVNGLKLKHLHSFDTEQVALEKWEPGTQFSNRTHFGGEEIFVVEGVLKDESGIYPKGTWLRNPPLSVHSPFSDSGCVIYTKVGHLGAAVCT